MFAGKPIPSQVGKNTVVTDQSHLFLVKDELVLCTVLYSEMLKLCILLQDNILQPGNIKILYSHAAIKGDVKLAIRYYKLHAVP
jgi:hypothetical protein